MTQRVKIVTFIPSENADALRRALGEAGAGKIGEYSYCSFTSVGQGRFVPSDAANPHIGEANVLETVDEERIEIVCERNRAKDLITVLLENHPYDEVAYDIYPLLELSDLES
jgi:hypothetical protein